MYQARYINPLIQFGRIDFVLILDDQEGVLETIRINKSFSHPTTHEILNTSANDTIGVMLQVKYDRELAAYESDPVMNPEPVLLVNDIVEASVDLPEGVSIT